MFLNCYVPKMAFRNEAKGVVGAIHHETMDCVLYFIKHKNDMYAPICIPKASYV